MAKKEKKRPIKEQPIKKQKTLKEKIDEIVDNVSERGQINKGELKKELFNLVQRVLYPNQFCPQCDERLFFDSIVGVYNCPNCGYQAQVTQQSQSITRPSQIRKVPPQVEKIIQESEKSMKEPKRVIRPTALGDKIRKLVDDRDSGGPTKPTPQDEAAVRRDKNVSRDINWV